MKHRAGRLSRTTTAAVAAASSLHHGAYRAVLFVLVLLIGALDGAR